MLKQSGGRFTDHFLSKQMIVDGIVISLVAYAFSSGIEYLYVNQYLNLSLQPIVTKGFLQQLLFSQFFF